MKRARFALLFCAALALTDMQLAVSAAQFNVEITGNVTEVGAIYNPLYDPIDIPPPPQVAPEFSSRFAVGQPVTVRIAYQDDAIDNVAAEYWGRYPLTSNQLGAIAIDGETYQLGGGGVSIQTNQPYTPRSDNFFFSSSTSQVISSPLNASRATLSIMFEGHDLFESDALVAPPTVWDTSKGEFYFDTGLVWQALKFSVSNVTMTAVPEPSTPLIALTALLRLLRRRSR